MNWNDAIKAVLQAENAPMHYVEITNKIIELGYKQPNEIGATPEASVNNQLTKHPELYKKVDNGTYKLESNNIGVVSKSENVDDTKSEKQEISDDQQRDNLI